MPRKGPSPLILHLTTLLCVWLSLPSVWRSLNNTSLDLKNDWASLNTILSTTETPALEKLRALQKRIDPQQAELFIEALVNESTRRVHRFTAAVKTYQHYPHHRISESLPVIWTAGTTQVYDYNPHHPKMPTIFVIPSLINRFDILDLEKDQSFLRWLVSRGYRPLVVDWNEPGAEETNFTVGDYITERLVPLLDFIVTQTHSPVHVLGYCMGGVLAVALASLQPRLIKSLLCLATPWDFHQPYGAIGQQFIALAERLEPALNHLNFLSVDIIQALFAVSQPLKVIHKYSAFSTMDMESTAARRFVILEDWLNDGVPLTANVARECFVQWYGKNLPARGEWSVAGHLIDPHKISIPSYVVVPGRDQIVPPSSALALAHALPHATLHEPMMGHVGLMASEHAAERVWAPLLTWLNEHG